MVSATVRKFLMVPTFNFLTVFDDSRMPFYSLIKTFVLLSLSLPQFEVRRIVLQVYWEVH